MFMNVASVPLFWVVESIPMSKVSTGGHFINNPRYTNCS